MSAEKKLREVVNALLSAFPDEILKPGQRLRVREVEFLNAAIIAAEGGRDELPAVYGSMGSVSSGTLRPADLVPAFASELRELATRAGRLGEVAKLLGEAEAWTEDDDDGDIGSEVVNDLSDALQAYAPAYFYFGSIEGNGADFGFWLSSDFQEQFRDGDGVEVSDTSEVPAGHVGEVLHINDHGNCTLYVADGRGNLREVWGVV